MRLPKPIATFAEKVRKKPPLQETGKATGSLYLSEAYRWSAINDDLVTAKGSSIYSDMRHDPELKAALVIMTAGILAKGWELQPYREAADDAKPSAAAKEQADFAQKCFDRIPGSLDDVLEETLRDAVAYGTGIAERNWEYIETGEHAGKIGYKSIKTKDPSTFYFGLDEFNNITTLEVQTTGAREAVPIDKFAIFTIRSEHGEPWGTSEFRAAYRWYWLKNNLVKWWAVFLEKYGMPTAKGSVPRATSKAARTELLNVLKTIQQETAIVVDETHAVEFLTAAQSVGQDGYQALIGYCDKQMVKSLIGQTLTTDEGERVGSMALGKVHESVQALILKRIRRRLEEYVDEQLIRPLLDYNFADPLYPNFSLLLDEKDVNSLSEAIFRLISCEQVDPRESWIREWLGLPAREELPPMPEPQLPQGPPKIPNTSLPPKPNEQADNVKEV